MFGTLLFILVVAYYFYVKKKMQLFAEKGVPHAPGYFPFGSVYSWKLLFGKVSFADITRVIYNDFPGELAVGYYGFGGSPSLVIRDLDLAKRICVKDFDHFQNRRKMIANPKANPYFTSMVTVLEGDKWRYVRHFMSPLFTSNRLKAILPSTNEVADDFMEYLETIKDEEAINTKTLFQLLTINNLAITGCGVKTNAFKDQNDTFYQMTIKMTGGGKPNPWQMAKFMLLFLAPKIAYAMNVEFQDGNAMEFVYNIIKTELDRRRVEKVKKHDFLDLLAEVLNEAKANGGVIQDRPKDEPESEFEKDADLKETVALRLPFDEIEKMVVSNALVLFFAGNDTTSTGLALVFHFLATNPDVQDRLLAEINEAVEANNGDEHLEYNALQGLTYMDKVIKESLRCWKFSFIERTCNRDYHIPEMDFTVPAGMLVQVAASGIMFDEKHFPNPDDFDPDLHFENENLIPPNFLMFGQGPRNCVGMRFAYTMMRTAVVRTLANYKILPCSKTPKEWVIDPTNPAGLPKGGLHVKLEKRN